ncbi:hypothetical protein [Streptomyces sp. SAI-090]|nr:hypothetical protein [Streptomyces sp. SAI-090]MDH6522346.1 hypothetical protein [Streptomyces sp. SAI-090]
MFLTLTSSCPAGAQWCQAAVVVAIVTAAAARHLLCGERQAARLSV